MLKLKSSFKTWRIRTSTKPAFGCFWLKSPWIATILKFHSQCSRHAANTSVLATNSWAPQVEGELAKAEAKFRESLGVKPDYVDAFQMLADLSMQRAKLAARFHAPLPR